VIFLFIVLFLIFFVKDMSERILTYNNLYRAHSKIMLAITGYIDCGDPPAIKVVTLDMPTLFKGCFADLNNTKAYIQPHANIAKKVRYCLKNFIITELFFYLIL